MESQVKLVNSDRASEEGGDAVFRWVVAALVASAALMGVVILVALVALALQPPDWIQMALGGVIALGTAGFAWLVASALGSGKGSRSRR